jgi:hypothetical protein
MPWSNFAPGLEIEQVRQLRSNHALLGNRPDANAGDRAGCGKWRSPLESLFTEQSGPPWDANNDRATMAASQRGRNTARLCANGAKTSRHSATGTSGSPSVVTRSHERAKAKFRTVQFGLSLCKYVQFVMPGTGRVPSRISDVPARSSGIDRAGPGSSFRRARAISNSVARIRVEFGTLPFGPAVSYR